MITEIEIMPIKPKNGLVAFVSFVYNDDFYCGGVALYTRPFGGYRLVYPRKNIGGREMNIFHPINASIGREIEKLVVSKFEKLINK